MTFVRYFNKSFQSSISGMSVVGQTHTLILFLIQRKVHPDDTHEDYSDKKQQSNNNNNNNNNNKPRCRRYGYTEQRPRGFTTLDQSRESIWSRDNMTSRPRGRMMSSVSAVMEAEEMYV